MGVSRLETLPNDYQSITPNDESGLRVFDAWWDGMPRQQSWVPVNVRLIDPRLRASDFPSLAGAPSVPVFSRRAADALEDLLAPSGELLLLDCDDGDYLAYNVTAISDALDWTASNPLYYSDGGVSWIHSPVFERKRLSSDAMFRIRNAGFVGVFVTEPFMSCIKDNGLVGCKLVQAGVI